MSSIYDINVHTSISTTKSRKIEKKKEKKLLVYHKFVDAPQLCKYDVNMINRSWITRKFNQSAPTYLFRTE